MAWISQRETKIGGSNSMSSSRIWLGISGSETLLLPTGRKLTENDTEIKREGRTVSGKLLKDGITTKKQFSFSYPSTTDAVMTQLEGIYALDTTLNLLIERKDTSIDNYAVLMRPLQRQRINTVGQWLWSISVAIEEV